MSYTGSGTVDDATCKPRRATSTYFTSRRTTQLHLLFRQQRISRAHTRKQWTGGRRRSHNNHCNTWFPFEPDTRNLDVRTSQVFFPPWDA